MLSRLFTPFWLALLVVGMLLVPVQPAQAGVPSGFAISSTLITVSSPTSLAFSPDEKLLFITEKGGKLRLADVSPSATLTLRTTAAIDLTARTCSNSERGLLSVAVDPDFATNRFLYLYYTYDRGITSANRCIAISNGQAATSETPVNRVSRFVLKVDGTIDLVTEVVLIDNMLSTAGNHNAGDLHVGRDGKLYVTVGDGGCDYAGGGCGGSNNASRDLNLLLGKVLRIDPAGATAAARIPNDNPFVATGTLCSANGRGPNGTPVGTACQETFAYGFRNPFRMAFDPNTTGQTTKFYVNDVGQGIWEEIDLAESGKDYRWNTCEGSHANGTRNPCAAPNSTERNPIHEYDHNDATNSPDTVGCNSITGGAVIPNGVWPAGYDGKYLFADYVCNKIFMIDPAAPTTRTLFADALSAPVDLQFGPGTNGLRALYLANIGNGAITRIAPASGNRPPLAVLSADPQYGALTVTFSGAGSSDPDGNPLTYLWDFGNGTSQSTSTATVTYTYPANGRYTATLQVRDSLGALSDPVTLTIDTLNNAPVPVITLPTNGATFAVGDTITLSGSATDAQDGPLANANLSWSVLLHHRAGQVGAHTHPLFGPQTGNNLTFVAPAPEDLDAASNSYLEIRLTATDSAGAAVTISRDLLPAKVALTVRTSPNGLKITANGTQYSDGDVITSWRNYSLTLAGLPQRASDGRWLALSTWEDNSTNTNRSILTPTSPQTYTATFGKNAKLMFMPFIRQP